jgi:anti-sigma-K factor RskA
MSNRNAQLEKDDRLADFTDRLLAGEIEQDVTRREPDPELAQMQETLRRMRQAFPPQQANAEMRNRIRARLTTEWRKNNIPVRTAQKSFLPSNRTLSLSLAIGAVAIIVLLVSFLPQVQTEISGTAGIGTSWIPFAIFIIVVAGLILWQLRKK